MVIASTCGACFYRFFYGNVALDQQICPKCQKTVTRAVNFKAHLIIMVTAPRLPLHCSCWWTRDWAPPYGKDIVSNYRANPCLKKSIVSLLYFGKCKDHLTGDLQVNWKVAVPLVEHRLSELPLVLSVLQPKQALFTPFCLHVVA